MLNLKIKKMKNAILSIIFLSLCTVAFAQKKVSFGLRGAANISNISNTNLEPKVGPYIGALVHFRFSKLYALQPELGYSNQGGDAPRGFDEGVDVHYLSLALTNNFFIKNSGFHFIISPSLDFDIDDSPISIANGDNDNDFTFLDMSIGLGFGYQLKSGLSIDMRYKQGVIDVFSYGWLGSSNLDDDNDNQLNNLFQLGVTYKFN